MDGCGLRIASNKKRGRKGPREDSTHLSRLSDSPGASTDLESGTATCADLFRKLESLYDLVQAMNANIKALTQKIELLESKHPAAKSNKKLPPALSSLVRQIHNNLEEQLQWKVQITDNFRTPHNEAVTAAVTQAVKDLEPNWGFRQIRRACNRVFESLKTNERMERNGSWVEVKRRKLLTSRRDRLFRKRIRIGEEVLDEDDLAYLRGANANFVSDEESNDEKNAFVYTSPKWRSTRLTTIMNKCQKALDENRKKGAEPKSTQTRVCAGFTNRHPPAENSCYVSQPENSTDS